MAYKYSKGEFYGWTLFSFTKDSQPIEVVFIKDESDESIFNVVVWSDNGANISNPHDSEFHDTLNEILSEFNDVNSFIFQVAVV